MCAFGNDSSIEGDIYIQRLANYIRRNEEALANGLLCFSKTRTLCKAKPLRPSFTIHHLYYVTERIATFLDVDVGPLNIELDTPNQEPTFVSFMANNARNQRHFESDARSITSMNSVKSIVSSASVYWMSFSFSKDPKVIQKDVKYIYSSFTKIPCLALSPLTKINSISGYEEYPCDTSLPLQIFKNLQVFELFEYEPHEVYGWHILSEKLRILFVHKTKVSDLAEILFSLVIDDENGRSSFNSSSQSRKFVGSRSPELSENINLVSSDEPLRLERAISSPRFPSWRRSVHFPKDDKHNLRTNLNDLCHPTLPETKWRYLKQLTVSQSSISSISSYVFAPLSNLVKLNLSGNLLEDLPEGLSQLHGIKYLNFADNYITNLKRLPPNLKHLITVNFNNNKIQDLEGIQNLHSVQRIDLRRNKLKSIDLVRGLVQLVAIPKAEVNNVFISSNSLPRNYRADLFNLLNGANPKNNIKIDDSRPGYFESAMLLDPDSSLRNYKKFMKIEALDESEPPAAAQESPVLPSLIAIDLKVRPQTPERQHGSSSVVASTDPLDSYKRLEKQDLENTFATRKNISTKTTASSTAETTPIVYATTSLINSVQSSIPLKSFPKSVMPLLSNQNLNNQPMYPLGKLPTIVRQYSFPMINLAGKGSEITLRSSVKIHKLDLEASALQTSAPSVITAVQVEVEGFQ